MLPHASRSAYKTPAGFMSGDQFSDVPVMQIGGGSRYSEGSSLMMEAP